MASPTIQLNSGHSMPAYGLGTWLSQPGEVKAAVKSALELGYRHVDCAHIYGNEGEVGEALTSVFSAGQIKRQDVFVTSKLWCSNFSTVKEACKLTLKNLQLDYLDLYLIHLPFEIEKDFKGLVEKGVGLVGYDAERTWAVWKCMEELVDEGLVKSIGLSNYTIKKTEELLKHSPRIKPACNQIELHPYLPQQRLFDYSKKEGIALVAYSPLANPGRPESFVCSDEVPLLQDKTIAQVAEKHKVTAAQVLLAWAIARGTGVIPKSVKEHRIKENLACLDVKLDSEDMKTINGIQTRYRFCKQPWALKAEQKYEDLWDGEMLE